MTLALSVLVVVIVAIATLRFLCRLPRPPRPPLKVTREASEWADRYYGDLPSRDTAARFIAILQEYGPADLSRVGPDAAFVEDLGLDDLEPVEIILAVEDEFKITVSEEDAARLSSVSRFIGYLESRLNENEPNKANEVAPEDVIFDAKNLR